jgi:mannose-6-phosphate isomerase-like protein (cupin superfamily)
MITSFVFTTLLLTVSASPWTYINRNVGAYVPGLPYPNAQLKYKLLGDQTDNQITTLELELLDEGPGYHSHIRENKMYHILEGNVQFIVNGTQFCAKPGDYVYVPHPLKQTFRISNPMMKKKRVKVQFTFFPGGFEHFLNDMGTLFLKGQDKGPQADKVAKKYGITSYGPVEWEELGCFDNDVEN